MKAYPVSNKDFDHQYKLCNVNPCVLFVLSGVKCIEIQLSHVSGEQD